MDKRFIMAGLAIILLATFARAVEINGGCHFEEHQCDLGKTALEVCNDTGNAVTYLVDTSGAKAAWLNPVPQEFTLNAGECRDVTIFMSSECYADPATYFSDVIIKGDEHKTITCQMDISQGHLVEIDIQPESYTATQCESKEYTVVISNLSEIKQETEPLYLEVIGLPSGWFELEDNEVFVSKEEDKTISLTIEPPCDTDLGAYEFTVEAVSTINPSFTYSDDAVFVLSQGQEIEIITEENYSACREEETTYVLTVKNNGKLADNITLELDAPAFVTMNKSSLSLEAGEEEEIEVAVARNTEETGAYTVKINAESQYDYETFAEFEVDLADCYSMEIARVEGYASVCSVDNPEYVFEITNTGSKVLDLDLGISGVDAELDVSEISLEAGETGTIRATLDVSKITSEIEEKTFTITAESEFEEASEELTIEVQKCYDVVISMPELKICRGITNTAEILIRNYGTKDQIVDLTVTPEWAVLENSITLASGESKKIKLIMDVPIDTIEENVELEAVYSGITLSESTKLNYGSQSYCFGIELGVKQKELEAAKCIGKTQEFELSNLGVTEQEIKLTSNVDWVYFEKELITLEEGQSETGYFVMIPPIDIAKGVYEIKIIAKSEYETIAFDEIKLNVFGQEFGEQPIDVDVHDLNVTKLIENISVDVEFRFYLLNDSNRTAKVYAITSPDFESVFVPEAETVKKMETISVKAYLDLPENYDQNFVIMSIDVNTDEGVIRKTLRFKLEEGTGEDSDEGNEEIDAGVVTLGSGLLTLENMANLGLIVLIAVVAALIVYAIVAKPKPKKKAKKKKKTKK